MFFFERSILNEFQNRKITFIRRKIIILPKPFETWCIKWYWIKIIGQNLEFMNHQWEINPYVILDAAIVQSYFDGRTMTNSNLRSLYKILKFSGAANSQKRACNELIIQSLQQLFRQYYMKNRNWASAGA